MFASRGEYSLFMLLNQLTFQVYRSRKFMPENHTQKPKDKWHFGDRRRARPCHWHKGFHTACGKKNHSQVKREKLFARSMIRIHKRLPQTCVVGSFCRLMTSKRNAEIVKGKKVVFRQDFEFCLSSLSLYIRRFEKCRALCKRETDDDVVIPQCK